MSVVEEFIKEVSESLEKLLEMKRQATQTARHNDDGSYDFFVFFRDGKVDESETIHVAAKDVEAIAINDLVDKRAFRMSLCSHIEGKDNSEKLFKYNQMSEQDKIALDNLALQDKHKFAEGARISLLIDEAVAPAIMNNVTQSSFSRAKGRGVLTGDENIAENMDGGYCTKSLTSVLYAIGARYEGFDFLPPDAETAAHPQSFLAYLKQQPQFEAMVKETPEGQSLRDMFLHNDYRAGAMAFLNMGDGHFHTMLYSGRIKEGIPLFMSFNNDDLSLPLRNKSKGGFVFDLPSAIERQQGKYKEYGDQKQEESLLVGNFEKEIPVSKGRHRIKMKVS